MMIPTAEDLFDLASNARAMFEPDVPVWEALNAIDERLQLLWHGRPRILGNVAPSAHVGEDVHIESGAVVESMAYIEGPAYIARGAVVRHGAYLRGSVALFPGSVVGHVSEAKNAIFLHGAKAPHFAYVGDSIVGANANLGAGVKLANLRLTDSARPGSTVHTLIDGHRVDTGRRKFGAVLGDGSAVGCNAVLNPGVVLGRESIVYASVNVPARYFPARSTIRLVGQRLEITAIDA